MRCAIFALFSLVGLLLVSSGCHQTQGRVLGKMPDGNTRTIISAKEGDGATMVTLSGTMVEKCPIAGCWFRLRDETGTIKVDIKSAEFTVVEVPIQSKVKVVGTIVQEGDALALRCSGLQY